MKHIISYILVLCIFLNCVIFVYSEDAEKSTTKISVGTVVKEGNVVVENDNYILDYSVDSFLLQVADKRNGYVWYGHYTSSSDDKSASGVVKTDMLSDIVVTYSFNNTTKTVNTFSGPVRKKTATVRSIKNGVRIDFEFKDLGFTVPVEYLLDNDGLKASVILSDIKENETNQVISVELLPYFGSEQSKDAEGYVFVPDGSGAVISLSEKQNGVKRIYDKRVYGEDLLTPSNLQTTYEQDIKVPVFGMKCGENAVVSIIEKGAESASICASAPCQLVDGATAYSRCIYRANGNVDVTMQNGSKTSSLFMSEPDNDFKKYTVKYNFLVGDKANYVGMAEKYRDYLKKNGLKDTSSGENRLHLDLYGGILKQSNFLGIPYKTIEALTTYDQAKTILEKYNEKDIKAISLGLKNYSKSSIKEMTEIEFGMLGNLGGKKGYKTLLSYAEKNGIDVYSYADFFSFSKSGNGIRGNSTKVYSLQKSPLRLKNFTIVDNYRVSEDSPISFVRPTKYKSAALKLVKNASKADVKGIALDDISSNIISDYSKSYVSRVDSKKMILSAVETIGNKYTLVSSSSNDYMWKYSKTITDIPTYSSKYIIFDYDVPFIQIVLKGTKDYSTLALNLSSMSTEIFLNAVESCSNIKFDGIYAKNSAINGTKLGDVFGANYKSWFDISVKWQNEIKKVYNAVEDSKITGHSVIDDVTVTVYENGVRVYVNYSQKDTEIDGITVPALWYSLKEGN